MEQRGPSWSEVYLDFTTLLPTITASLPVFSETGDILGVCATDVLLPKEFRSFLASLEIGKTGEAFVIDRSGQIISSSTNEPLTVGEGESATLLQAIDSREPLIQETAAYLQRYFSTWGNIQEPAQLDFRLKGERQMLQVVPFKDGKGLDWLIVIAVPESDFMAQIYANTRNTVLLSIVALVIATGVGILTARWVIRPLLELNNAAKDIAKGELDRTVEIQRSDEVGELANSFNAMAGQLQESFQTLEAKDHGFNKVSYCRLGSYAREVERGADR